MDAAVLSEVGGRPQFAQFEDPVATEGSVVVQVAAAGVNHLDIAKASGGFYLGPPTVPSVLGSDGVGHLDDGRRVFFDTTISPFGAWAQRSLVPVASLLAVSDAVDDAVAAALGNAGLAGWLSLDWRARLQPGETVMVLGATGAMGSAAVQIAKILGAKRVVGVDVDPDRLADLRGADATVALGSGDDFVTELRDATEGGADVIIDPLWGEPAHAAMKAARHGARHIQIGTMAGTDLALPAATVRSKAIDLLGFAIFHAPLPVRQDAYLRMTAHAAKGDITANLERVPLRDIQAAWERQKAGAGTKLVLIP